MNIDPFTVRDFGREWQRFDQTGVSESETIRLFNEYFAIFPFHRLPEAAVGFDAGCGTGRWAALAARKVGHLHCVDASPDALVVASEILKESPNVTVHEAAIEAMPLADASMDFGYSVGVLHHLPDPEAGLAACVRKLKPGAPMLVYIYYAFDNRPAWFRAVWRASDVTRQMISKLPFRIKAALAEVIAASVYWPLARLAALLEKLGLNTEYLPLSAYRHRSYYVMRNDALDRFGTRLEHRMTRDEIARMMERAGLRDVCFSAAVPFWCAVGYKA